MPFISKDWRSPGEEWVKTQEGWEKKKVLECTAQRYPAANFNDSGKEQTRPQDGEDDISTNKTAQVPPHCHITIKCTREIAGFNGLSDAVRRLDFSSAVRDVRRFNYICALLELLLAGEKLTNLPGAAQKVLLSMLEQLADHVATSQQNVGALRLLAARAWGAREARRGACWGAGHGARALWGRHDRALARVHQLAHSLRIREPGPEVVPKLHDLPEECIREIILRISDHRDLEAASSAWSVMASVCAEQRIWRELVYFHYTKQQIDSQLEKNNDTKVDWKTIYHQLRKLFGSGAGGKFAETLSLCRHCTCLYWRQLGHPCIADQCPEYREKLKESGGPLPPHPVPPAAFLKFFSL